MTQVHVSTEKRLKDFAGSAFYTENNNNKKISSGVNLRPTVVYHLDTYIRS